MLSWQTIFNARDKFIIDILFTVYVINRWKLLIYLGICVFQPGGSGSSVGIATDYGLDGPGSNPGGDEIFRPSRPALGPTQPPLGWVPGLSRG